MSLFKPLFLGKFPIELFHRSLNPSFYITVGYSGERSKTLSLYQILDILRNPKGAMNLCVSWYSNAFLTFLQALFLPLNWQSKMLWFLRSICIETYQFHSLHCKPSSSVFFARRTLLDFRTDVSITTDLISSMMISI